MNTKHGPNHFATEISGILINMFQISYNVSRHSVLGKLMVLHISLEVWVSDVNIHNTFDMDLNKFEINYHFNQILHQPNIILNQI